ncbi:hypothetical protein F3Y22_tig00009942pilonHSYRG00285 [Hibiscus syriacus]|uniref:Reverse transcriptase domain-containing protein n=1 Tax=Hibiscus syriacus TaxID=106335 RepID=A0A6A3CB86_HIBSY|nr:hypothetical protein F3Y22_tig00009942pilonHSYRG00285 [Hibiscus syriacus]
MIVSFWNVRGFNNPLKQKKVLLRACQYNVNILCLLETRVKTEKFNVIFDSFSVNWYVTTNYDSAINGRIWIIWNKNIELSTFQVLDQIISVKGKHNGFPFVISVIYGSNDTITRRHLWQNLLELGRNIGHLPWILGGDFNITLHPNESSDYELLSPSSTPEMKEFQDVTQALDLHDHPYFSPLFTWSNKQSGSYLARKFDRVLINPNWVSTFHSSFVEFLSPGVSDHCMAIVWLFKDNPTNRTKPFKFFNFWTLHPGFLKEVEQSWQVSFQGKKRIDLDHQQLLSLRGEDSIDKELHMQQELNNLEEAELLFLKQKAKIHWIKDRDQCTKFFHSAVNVKNKRETIRMLIDEQGNRLESFDSMATEVVIAYYSNLIGTADPKVKGTDVHFLKDLLNYSLPPEYASNLVKKVTTEEIKESIFGQGNDKAPGPDGFTPLFFKRAWSIVGDNVATAVKYLFHHSTLLHAFNSTTIALIPKIPNPSKVKDFIPISCCSVIYKSITKILVKRLTSLVPRKVSLNQTTFIKGRSIVDNTLLAQELVKGYGRKSISPRCSLKIDLQKAFDTLHWDFISIVLKALKLPQRFINWIEACFSEARFSISFNGNLIGYFRGARGIRQGDPLSPILFVLSMNILSSLFNLVATKGLFNYHPKCKRIGLTHLSFADDLLIFCKGNVDSVVGIIYVLDRFYEMSGLNLNAGKCVFFTAGISNNSIDLIRRATGFHHGCLPVRYLGLPLCRQLLLPQFVVRKIEQLCSRFFWKGADKSATGVRVYWGEGSLWVAWINAYVIKDKDLWNMDGGPSLSWSFNRILKLRTTAFPILLSGASTIREIWLEIHNKENKVPWHSLIWFPHHIPKHSLIAWMAILDRLPTRDRLIRIGINTNGIFVLCNEMIESRNHLFFDCSTASVLRGKILLLNRLNKTFSSWDDMVTWTCNTWKGKSLISTILKLAWCANIYVLWEERNRRIFKGCSRTADELLNNIRDFVGIKLSGKNINRLDYVNSNLCTSWEIRRVSGLNPGFADHERIEHNSPLRSLGQHPNARQMDLDGWSVMQTEENKHLLRVASIQDALVGWPGLPGVPTTPIVKRVVRLDVPVDKYEEKLKDKPGYEHLNEPLHLLVEAEFHENVVNSRLDHAVGILENLLKPMDESLDDYQKQQLRELALLNGTLREESTSVLPFSSTGMKRAKTGR